jgi:hypothetical protein
MSALGVISETALRPTLLAFSVGFADAGYLFRAHLVT